MMHFYHLLMVWWHKTLKSFPLQGSTLRAVRLSRTGKNVENGSLDRLFYNATCLKGQVKNRTRDKIVAQNCTIPIFLHGLGLVDKWHLIQDRWISNLTCPNGQVTLKIKFEPCVGRQRLVEDEGSHNLCCWYCCYRLSGYTNKPWHPFMLTHWGRDKMATIFKTTFSNAFSWTKMFKFRLIFHWSLFPRVQLTIFHHWFK